MFKRNEIKYNVEYKIKNDVERTSDELKRIFNIKLANVIVKIENQGGFDNS